MVYDDRDLYGQQQHEADQANREATTDRRISRRPRPSDAECEARKAAARIEYADLERRIFG